MYHFENEEIREQDGNFSVYDIISVIGGCEGGGERKIWQRLKKDYPETVTKCHSVKLALSDGKKENLASPAAERNLALKI